MPTKKSKDIFSYFDDLVRQIEEEFEQMEREFFKAAEKGGTTGYKPYVYGFKVTMGPDGKPVVEEFGNVKRIGNKPLLTEEREPLVDVIEKNDEIRVVVEVPGVDKNDIKVKINGDILVISANSQDKKYYKEVELPAAVDENSAKANYKNGVLEVVMKKKVVTTGKDIKVE
ncbi:MAG: archaeal heat shock protein Hsp20 [Metallosphaera sp.]|uniref:Heat shock protein Hsp20 n=1 Tax=Metallosphaera cuprina (strain Ar-4) TaxID=1006006 RepID=F4FZ51_METCR|nr:archaeal heat shock protein Hsp20 [Metallosphaera cuprina]AEB95621.1 heat shock protein Hsp20 [Metallosphaera cuprina Ar-4]